MKSEVPSRALEWTNAVLGVGLACTAFLFTDRPVIAWNAGILGTLIACCSMMALYRYASWVEWTNLSLGCWAIAAPFLLGFGASPVPTWTSIATGACVASIAGLQLAAGRKAGTPSGTRSFAGD